MKSERQKAILQLVRTTDIFTQDELTEALAEAGFPAAQATVSRDIRDLRLTKETTAKGQKYVAPKKRDIPNVNLDRIFADAVLSVESAGNMVVIRTVSGLAMAVALAVDEMNFAEVLGTISGDDTVFCVVKTEAATAELLEKLKP